MTNKYFIEYDNQELENISNTLYNLFLSNNYNVSLLDNSIPINEKTSIIANNPNSFVISNKINNDTNTLEIIYPLRKTNTLVLSLVNNLDNITDVSKYYQLRSSTNTALDYYEILRNFNNSNGLVIKYGNNTLNNNQIPLIIYETITNNSSNTYTVSSGDSLYAIARRFNTTVDAIKNANNLTSNNLSIGQKLIIPRTNQNNTNNNNNNDNNQSNYTVVSGDSLYAIARRFNTTVDAIKNANNLTSNNLSIGQKLIIPLASSSTQTTYTIVSGDSLYAIARRFNTTVDAIKKANNLTSNNLSIGQKLIIPIANSSTQTTYTVVSGDSLYAIARRFNTTVDAIKKANNLTSNNLSIGQKLII